MKAIPLSKDEKELPVCKKCKQVHTRCSGHRKRTKTDGVWTPCMRRPIKGNKGCPAHRTGLTVGTKNGNFRHGKFSKYAPKGIDARLAELQDAKREGEYLSLGEQIDFVEVRISQLIEQLNTSASQKTWIDIKNARRDIIKAVKDGDANLMDKALKVLDDVSLKGGKEYRAWDELTRMQRHYNLLITSERKKLIEDKFMLSLEDVSIILAMIGHAINEKVKDATIRKELAKEIGLISEKAGFEIT